MLADITSVGLHTALAGLSMRGRVTADNIANIQTPGFLAGRVTFEDALREAVRSGAPASAEPSLERSLEPTREDGNNVNFDHETIASIDTGLRYQAVLRAVDDKFGILRTVIRG